MRFFLPLIAVGAIVVSNQAHAQRKYGMAGCGLGSVVFGTGGGTTAATTNGSFYSQLFGISFGTSNCVPDKAQAALMKQEAFVATNYPTLTKEMARGEGQTIAGLAEVLGCPQSHVSSLGAFTQSRFDSLVSAPGSMAMLDKLKFEMSEDATLSQSCEFAKLN